MGLHAKTMVIDSEVLVVSSFNLDPRSANLNTELATVVHHAGLAQMVEDLIVEEMAAENAWHTTYDFNPDKEAPFGRRFKMRGRNWFGRRDSVIGVSNGDSGGGIITACRVAAVSPIDPQHRMPGHGQ